MKHRQRGCLCSPHISMIFLMFTILSLVPLPFRKPACSSEISCRDVNLILWMMIFRLLAWQMRLVVQWFAHSFRLSLAGAQRQLYTNQVATLSSARCCSICATAAVAFRISAASYIYCQFQVIWHLWVVSMQDPPQILMGWFHLTGFIELKVIVVTLWLKQFGTVLNLSFLDVIPLCQSVSIFII